MPQIRDRRVRIALAVVLIASIGVALSFLLVNLRANHHYNLANQALERYEFSEAREHLDHYLWWKGSDANARLLAAQTARRGGDFDAADKLLRAARKHGAPSDVVDVEQNLLRVQQGNLAGADELMQFCAQKPGTMEASLGLEAVIEGSLRTLQIPLARSAIGLWLSNRSTKLDQARGLVWRGKLSEFSEDLPQALIDYRQAVEAAPDFILARVRLAEALLREDPRQASVELDWLRQRAPKNHDVRFLTARERRNLGQPEEAGRILDDLLVEQPERVGALVERGRVAMDLHQLKDAERWLRQAVDQAPEQREVNIALAECLRLDQRPAEAERYQKKADEVEARLKNMLEQWNKKDKGP